MGLKHCHDRDVFHRDLKPENIFATQDGVYKLGDFGISKLLSPETANNNVNAQGTLPFMAPEVFDGKAYTLKSDVWALGVLIYYLLTFRYPF